MVGRRYTTSQVALSYYRCKFPAEYTITEQQRAKTIYVQEAAILPSLDQWIGSLFSEAHLDATCTLAAVSNLDLKQGMRRQAQPLPGLLARQRAHHRRQLDRRSRKRAPEPRTRLGRKPTNRKLTTAEIKALVRQLKGIVGVLAEDRGSRRQTSDLQRTRRQPHVPSRRTRPRRCMQRCTQGSCRSGDSSIGARRDSMDSHGLVGGVTFVQPLISGAEIRGTVLMWTWIGDEGATTFSC